MAEELDIPPEFGGSWQNFVGDWCLSAALAHEPCQVARALRALCRLWPTEVARLMEDATRGVGVLASAVELGSMLDTCETAERFQEVFQRLKAGERSAYSELVLVAALSRLGYAARFAPPIGGHVLDAACPIDGSPVCFEVVAPRALRRFSGRATCD